MANNETAEDTLLTLTADIVAAHVSNNSVAVNDLPNLIQNVHAALTDISQSAAAPEPKAEPKVSIRSSIKPDAIALGQARSRRASHQNSPRACP